MRAFHLASLKKHRHCSDTYYGNCSLPHKESLVTTQWAPSVDGVVVPDIPRKLLETGRAAHVPVLLGSNLNEGSTFITGHIGDEREFEEYFNKTFGETSGKEDSGNYDLIQVIDEEGKPIEPAWSKFVAYKNDAEKTGERVGEFFYGKYAA